MAQTPHPSFWEKTPSRRTERVLGMPDTTKLFHPSTGEVREIDAGDDEESKRKRQYLYMQGWKRIDRMRCNVQWDMYRCAHKRRHPERFHLLYLYDLHTEDKITGNALQHLTKLVQEAYEQWHVARLYCVRALQGQAECSHTQQQRALFVDTEDYLKHLGYVEHYQQTDGDRWTGLWEKRCQTTAIGQSRLEE